MTDPLIKKCLLASTASGRTLHCCLNHMSLPLPLHCLDKRISHTRYNLTSWRLITERETQGRTCCRSSRIEFLLQSIAKPEQRLNIPNTMPSTYMPNQTDSCPNFYFSLGPGRATVRGTLEGLLTIHFVRKLDIQVNTNLHTTQVYQVQVDIISTYRMNGDFQVTQRIEKSEAQIQPQPSRNHFRQLVGHIDKSKSNCQTKF